MEFPWKEFSVSDFSVSKLNTPCLLLYQPLSGQELRGLPEHHEEECKSDDYWKRLE
jgi:hypothetical protein